MKSASARFGGTASKKKSEDPRRPGESHARLRSAPGAARQAEEAERGRALCAEAAPAALRQEAPPSPPSPPNLRTPRRPRGARPEEPRTGVVRRADVMASEASLGPRQAPRQASNEGLRARAPSAPADGQQGDWRCLEWGGPPKERRPKRNSKVTIVQLAQSGELVRQNGPDTWLPEAGSFVQRMSRLVAQGLGFERCRSLCLRSSSTVLTVADAGEKVMLVSGPVGSMTNVLRRAGLE